MVIWYMFTSVAKGAGYLQFRVSFMSASHRTTLPSGSQPMCNHSPIYRKVPAQTSPAQAETGNNKQGRKTSTFKKVMTVRH